MIDEWGNWFESHLPGHHPVRTAEGWFGRDHRTSAASAAAAVTINTRTPGGPVSLSADLHAFAARLEHYDEEALIALDAVKGNAATASAFTVLHDLTGFNVSPDIITLVTTGLTELRDRLKASAQPADPSFTPAGPQVAGQA